MKNETSNKQETANSDLGTVSGSYIIRIYDQDLCSEWIDRGGYKTPNKYLSKKELIEDLETNGLEIVQFAFSSFGACYFFEVKGEYNGNVEYEKLETRAVDFCWSV